MTMTKDNTATGPPSTSSRRTTFLACFGYSGDKTNKVNSTSRQSHRIFKWGSSCKKSTTKTVHVDFQKSKSVNEAPAKYDWEIQVVEDESTLTKKHVITVTSEEQKPGRKKWTDVVKRENGSFRGRRKDIKPAATSATGASMESPAKKDVMIAQPVVLRPLTHSKSLPAPVVAVKRQKPRKGFPVDGGVNDGVGHKTTELGGEFDAIIAMTILLVILVIMVLWGKLCAIVCTCAWFFVAPRQVAAGENSAVATAEGRLPESDNKLSMESVEYKKKVVLEGLLQRNHRNVVGRL